MNYNNIIGALTMEIAELEGKVAKVNYILSNHAYGFNERDKYAKEKKCLRETIWAKERELDELRHLQYMESCKYRGEYFDVMDDIDIMIVINTNGCISGTKL